jgi:hypothetical protein
MKRLAITFGLLSILFVQNVFTQKNTECQNLVPDEITAIKIAVAVWLPIYGKAIYRKKPFVAKLISDNVWQVSGTLKTQKGGVPYIEIQRCDSKILMVIHTK